MPKHMFKGFDYSQYDAEVRERWGDEAANRSNDWWNGLGADGQQRFRQQVEDLNAAWDTVIASGVDATAEPAQQLAARHVAWLGSTMPQHRLPKAQVKGIVQLYVDDERCAANYNRVSRQVRNSYEAPCTTGPTCT